jgi:acetoin utilization protein AcuC
MVRDGLRVVYLDVDVHHGDGVESAFYGTDQVLTISIHQDGRTLFPGTGFPEEIGEGPGRGYAVNLPLAPETDDDLYFWAFMEVVPPLVSSYDPDVLVTQLGVDTLTADPLAAFNLSINGFARVVEEIKSWNLKWVALGGGGYEIMNVARAWTRAWAIMKGVVLPENLPESFVSEHHSEVGHNPTLSTVSNKNHPIIAGRVRAVAKSAVERIKDAIFPIIGV